MTGPDALVIEPLARRHERAGFSCGLPELDRYLARQAGQDVRRRIARVFVCTVSDTDTVLGFYTLSALAVGLASLPADLARKLPRHPVPSASSADWQSIDRRRGAVSGGRFSPMPSSASWTPERPSPCTR